jgi:hypothetical protein
MNFDILERCDVIINHGFASDSDGDGMDRIQSLHKFKGFFEYSDRTQALNTFIAIAVFPRSAT